MFWGFNSSELNPSVEKIVISSDEDIEDLCNNITMDNKQEEKTEIDFNIEEITSNELSSSAAVQQTNSPSIITSTPESMDQIITTENSLSEDSNKIIDSSTNITILQYDIHPPSVKELMNTL